MEPRNFLFNLKMLMMKSYKIKSIKFRVILMINTIPRLITSKKMTKRTFLYANNKMITFIRHHLMIMKKIGKIIFISRNNKLYSLYKKMSNIIFPENGWLNSLKGLWKHYRNPIFANSSRFWAKSNKKLRKTNTTILH